MSRFISDAGLWIDIRTINALLETSSMRPGKEHRVAYLASEDRVVKIAVAQALVTESLHGYLTDLILSNFYFDDDLQLLGCYQDRGRLHIVTTQPYVDGQHPDWDELKTGLMEQGLRDPNPFSKSGAFIIDDEVAGEIDVYDLHTNNVIRDSKGWLNPIDAHFYFDDRPSRMAALKALGLDTVVGPTDLALRLADNESDFFKT